VWKGIVALIETGISTGAFGYKYPENCQDGCGPIGTDEECLSAAIMAEIPGIEWPLRKSNGNNYQFPMDHESCVPDKIVVFDLIEFCYHAIAKPSKRDYHEFFHHDHLNYDEWKGKVEFTSSINGIFARNGIAYELDSKGSIHRLGAPIMADSIRSSVFRTRDSSLNQMLEESRNEYFDPDPAIRKEAVERLWDCWERLKTQADPANKKNSIAILLDQVSCETKIRVLLEGEAQKLTEIGNEFYIRHKEVKQCEVSDIDIVDYLFHRLFSMILLLLRRL